MSSRGWYTRQRTHIMPATVPSPRRFHFIHKPAQDSSSAVIGAVNLRVCKVCGRPLVPAFNFFNLFTIYKKSES